MSTDITTVLVPVQYKHNYIMCDFLKIQSTFENCSTVIKFTRNLHRFGTHYKQKASCLTACLCLDVTKRHHVVVAILLDRYRSQISATKTKIQPIGFFLSKEWGLDPSSFCPCRFCPSTISRWSYTRRSRRLNATPSLKTWVSLVQGT